MSAVGTLVGAGYGFICGAYMPIANFPDGLQKVLSFLPGTYATSLLHNHWMRGALGEMGESGVPVQVLDAIRDSIDCNIYFFGRPLSQGAMYLILAGSVVLVTAVYVLINVLCRPTVRRQINNKGGRNMLEIKRTYKMLRRKDGRGRSPA